jgi:hypothetical protein
MGKPEDNTSDWVSRRMSALDSDAQWEPDLDRGVRHMRSHAQHVRRRRRMRQGALLAILIAGVVFVSMPATRGVAERLLNRFSSKDVEAVRLNRPKLDLTGYLPKVEVVTRPGASNRVESIEQATKAAGFAPRLPKEFLPKIVAGSIVLGVRGKSAYRATVNVANLKAGLRARGIDNIDIPAEWDGLEMTQQQSPSINASFKDGSLDQGLPPVLLAPSALALPQYFEISLIIAGLSEADAHRLGNRLVESGGVFSMVPSDARTKFSDVTLANNVHGMLFQNESDFDESDRCSLCPGAHALVLVWTTADRTFLLRTPTLSVDEAVRLANSIE